MSEKYFHTVIEDFILENSNALLSSEIYGLNIFKLFCCNKYRHSTIETFSDEIIGKFLLFWLPSNINKLQDKIIIHIAEGLDKFFFYALQKYGLSVNLKCSEAGEDLERIASVNKQFSRFLNNPVLSYSPMIIDLERYRKQKQRSNNCGYTEMEQGYFVIKDIFPGNCIVLRKLVTGRFVKIGLDKELIDYVKPDDILYMSIKQTPFLSWEIEEVKKYFPSGSYKYIL